MKNIFSLVTNFFLKREKVIINTLLFGVSIIALINPAIENRFPILHPDSGSYIAGGFENFIPVSRPITYAWFVRHISMYHTLWFVIIAQAIIITAMIILVFKHVLKTKYSFLLACITIFVLSYITGISHIISQIMPDLFISVSLLGFFLIITRKRIPLILAVILISLVIFANVAHLSNLPIITATIVCTLLLFWIFRKKMKFQIKKSKLIMVIAVLVISWITIPIINLSYKSGFYFTRVSNVVFTARLINGGLLNEYVEDKCSENDEFFLCKYKEVIADYENRFDLFLWSDTSFLYDESCNGKSWDSCWINRDKDFEVVSKDFKTKPKYLKQWIAVSISDGLRQFTSFGMITFSPKGKGTHLHYPIHRFFKRDYEQYINASQQFKQLRFKILTKIQNIVVIISTIIILVFLLARKLRDYIDSNIQFLLVSTVISLIINAIFIATFAVVTPRFQARLIWIIPLIVILLISSYFTNKEDSHQSLHDKG